MGFVLGFLIATVSVIHIIWEEGKLLKGFSQKATALLDFVRALICYLIPIGLILLFSKILTWEETRIMIATTALVSIPIYFTITKVRKCRCK